MRAAGTEARHAPLGARTRAERRRRARSSKQLHPGLRGRAGRHRDPAATASRIGRCRRVEGKEFFTAEIDAALLDGQVDFTVHSYKDLSLERSRAPAAGGSAATRAAARHRVVRAPTCPQRLAAGHELAIGTSSPRRMSFVPDFLQRSAAACAPATHARAHAAGGTARQCRLAAAPAARAARLGAAAGWHRAGLCGSSAAVGRRSRPSAARAAVRAAAAHGAAAVGLPGGARAGRTGIECRDEDAATARCWPRSTTRPRAALSRPSARCWRERGGGCHQRFGATQIEVPELGTLLVPARGRRVSAQLRWTPGSGPARHRAGASQCLGRQSRQRAAADRADRGRHRRCSLAQLARNARRCSSPMRARCPSKRIAAIDSGVAHLGPGTCDLAGAGRARPVGRRLRRWSGHWRRSSRCCASRCCSCRRCAQWTRADARRRCRRLDGRRRSIATYRHVDARGRRCRPRRPADATHVYWHSSAQFDRWRHAGCRHERSTPVGQARPIEHLRRAGVQNLRMFPHCSAMAHLAAPVKDNAGKGGLSMAPMRRTVVLAVAAALWLSLQIVLVVWWATVIERQARQIAALEALRGGGWRAGRSAMVAHPADAGR